MNIWRIAIVASLVFLVVFSILFGYAAYDIGFYEFGNRIYFGNGYVAFLWVVVAILFGGLVVFTIIILGYFLVKSPPILLFSVGKALQGNQYKQKIVKKDAIGLLISCSLSLVVILIILFCVKYV